MFLANPFMSQWLSMANTVASTLQAHWVAEMQRQQAAFLSQMSRQAMRFWTGGWMLPLPALANPVPPAAAEPTLATPAVITERSAPPPSEVPESSPTPKQDDARSAAQLRSPVHRRSAAPSKLKTRRASSAKRSARAAR